MVYHLGTAVKISQEMGQSLGDHSGGAQRIVRVLEEFVLEFVDRDRHTNCDGTSVFQRGEDLTGEMVGQLPERFTEEQLIVPLLESFGYEVRTHPRVVTGLNSEVPDFTFIGFNPTAIGEIKTPNDIVKGRNQGWRYLEGVERYPVVAICTDGLTWVFYLVDEEENIERVKHLHLRPVAKKLHMEKNRERSPRKLRRPLREECTELADMLSPSNLGELCNDLDVE